MEWHVCSHNGEDGWHVVTCHALPGCVSQGKTEQEALDNMKEAILAWLEVEDEKAIEAARQAGLQGKIFCVVV